MGERIMELLIGWGLPVLILVAGLLAGWLFKRFVHQRLKLLTGRTRWRGDDVLLEGIKTHIVLWFFLAALYIASRGISIASPYNDYLARLVLLVLILSVTLAGSKVLVGLLNLWAERQAGFPPTAIFTNLVRITVISIGVMVVLQTLNISITPLLTALGVGGLAVGLALKDTLADFFSGLHILLSQKVKPGDFVQLDSGEMGYIINITWRNTTMMERANNVISIPNARLSTAIVKNYDSRDSSFSIKVLVGVAYDSDLEKVERVALETAKAVVAEVEGAVKDFEPALRFYEFADSSINFRVYFRGQKYGDHHAIVHEFIKRLHRRFEEEKIEIPFPIRTLVHKNPSP